MATLKTSNLMIFMDAEISWKRSIRGFGVHHKYTGVSSSRVRFEHFLYQLLTNLHTYYTRGNYETHKSVSED
jgi:hypothetical protein